jgi:hypothetical protein
VEQVTGANVRGWQVKEENVTVDRHAAQGGDGSEG